MWCELTKHRHDHDNGTHPIDSTQTLPCVSRHAADPSGFWLRLLEAEETWLHGAWNEDVGSTAASIPSYDASQDSMCPLRSRGHYEQRRRAAMARSLNIQQEARSLFKRKSQAGGAGKLTCTPEDSEDMAETACCVEGAFLSLSRRHEECLGCFERKDAGLALCWRCWKSHGGSLCWACHAGKSFPPARHRGAFVQQTQSFTQWLGARSTSSNESDCGAHTTFANYAGYDEEALQAQVAACARVMRRFPAPCPPPSRGSFDLMP